MHLSIIIFITGLIVGSFLNVVIYRLPHSESVIFPRSHCPVCNRVLKPYDLVPLLSFILLRGRCRYCRSKISWQYPAVELLTATIYLLLYLKYGLSSELCILLFLCSLLIILSFIDLNHQIVPNKVTYPGIVVALSLAYFFPQQSFNAALKGMVIAAGFLLIFVLFFKQGMGMGDVKLAALIGTFLGYKITLLGIFIGSLLGSISGLILILAGVMTRRTRIPFVPLISSGTLIMILFGKEILNWYLSLFF